MRELSSAAQDERSDANRVWCKVEYEPWSPDDARYVIVADRI